VPVTNRAVPPFLGLVLVQMPPRRKAKNRAYAMDAALLDLPEAKTILKAETSFSAAAAAAPPVLAPAPSSAAALIPVSRPTAKECKVSGTLRLSLQRRRRLCYRR
jgi:hypothetical protein